MMKSSTAITSRKVPEIDAPSVPPSFCSPGMRFWTLSAAMAMASDIATTMVEWPSEKKKPTPSGFFPRCIRYRVVSSTAEMWSASKAWRSPKL